MSECKEPMLLDLSLYNDLSAASSHHTLLACTPETEKEEEGSNTKLRRLSTERTNYEEETLPLKLATWGESSSVRKDADSVETLLQSMQAWLGQSSQDNQFHMLGQYGENTAGLYIGPRFDRADAGKAIVEKMVQSTENSTASLSALQTV
ncbi:hypothetical protein BDV19DRAFT_387665 [Aspergillus venezuelensis]